MALERTENIFLGSTYTLPAKELNKYRYKQDYDIPSTGIKVFEPDGSWLQSKRLEKVLENRKIILKEERVESRCNLVKAKWDPETNRVKLTLGKGKFWQYAGYSENGLDYLHPEEALFLMDLGVLEIYYGDLPLSVQQGYTCLLKEVSLIEYQVYAYLCRLGFIVFRHGVLSMSVTTEYEKKIGLDKSTKRQNKLFDKRKRENTQENDNSVDHKDYVYLKDTATKMEKPDSEKYFTFVDNSNTCRENTDKEQIVTHSIFDDHNKSSVTNRCLRNDLTDNVVSSSQSCTETYLSNEKKSQIDTGHICDICDRSAFKLAAELSSEWAKRLPHTNWNGCPMPDLLQSPLDIAAANFNYTKDLHHNLLKFSFDTSGSSHKIKATNWTEYKRKLAKLETFSCAELHSGPLGHLWNDEVTPLVKPWEACTTGAILKKLQVIKTADFAHKPFEIKKKINYDVFTADLKGNFRKTDPGTPHYRVIVRSASDDPPDFAELMHYIHQMDAGVGLLMAVVSHGSISFFEYSDFSLPEDVTMG